MIIPGTPGSGALSVLNLAENQLGELVLPEGWTEDYDSDEDEEVYKHTDGREQKDNPGKPEGIIAIANAIPDMGALTTLILKDNKLLTPEAGKVLSDMLAVNTVLKEFDLSGNSWAVYCEDLGGGLQKGDGPGFAKELAVGISDNVALTKFDISSNDIWAEGGKALAAGLKGNQGITELDISENYLGLNVDADADTSGITAVANAISDMGAMTSLNLASNDLRVAGAKIVAACLPKCT
jgi:hypothetical protein